MVLRQHGAPVTVTPPPAFLSSNDPTPGPLHTTTGSPEGGNAGQLEEIQDTSLPLTPSLSFPTSVTSLPTVFNYDNNGTSPLEGVLLNHLLSSFPLNCPAFASSSFSFTSSSL